MKDTDAVAAAAIEWNHTSCVVLAADAPERPQVKRVSEVAGAVVEFLSGKPSAVRKPELVQHFEDRYTRSAVYRELKKLVAAGVVHEAAGMVAAHTEVRTGADRCETPIGTKAMKRCGLVPKPLGWHLSAPCPESDSGTSNSPGETIAPNALNGALLEAVP